jgi:hypothetical protein
MGVCGVVALVVGGCVDDVVLVEVLVDVPD